MRRSKTDTRLFMDIPQNESVKNKDKKWKKTDKWRPNLDYI